MSEHSYHGATSRSTMKDRSDDPSHHERTLLPRSYISLLLEITRLDPTTHRTMSERSYHGATTRNSSMGPPWRIDPTTHHTMTYISLLLEIAQWVHPMKDRSDNPSHHDLHLAPTRNSSMGPPWRIDLTTHLTMSEHSYHGATSHSTMKDRSDDPSHHDLHLAPTRNSSMGPPWRIDLTTHLTMSEHSYHGATSHSTMKDRSDDPSHHELHLAP